MRYNLALALIIIGAVLVFLGLNSGSSTSKFYSYEEGLKVAKSTGKPILLYIRSSTCVYCKIFEEDYSKYEELRKALSRFVIVRVDYVNERNLASKYGATGTPEFHFLYPNGTPIVYNGRKLVMIGYSTEYMRDLINLANLAYSVYEKSKT